MSSHRQRTTWIWAAALIGAALTVRLTWVLSVPTVPVSDFAMYRESANYLSEFGRLDPGFIYMPGFVALLAAIKNLGGDLLAQKMVGVAFGALGAAALFGLTWALLDRDAAEAAGDRWRRLCPCPYAAGATALYAFWPAGVAMSSVVGTDVPAAALVVAALALLAALAPARPLAAALAFGAAMGLAAWVRAVALPLSGLSIFYWLARRTRLRVAVAYTAAGLAAALVVLLPWGIRHLRQSGALYFTDDHGGITALIGANPNSEGTYTRALNSLFKDVTGRGVLDEPHHATDQAAYAIVREWTRFEPRYTLGLVTLKADRLFDPEQRLLYWPLFRPGVLVGPRAAWFAARHASIAALADDFGLAVAGLALAGIACALVRRRWALLSLLPFQLALAATYTLFFAEPRYRLPIEMLAFPFVAVAGGELGGLAVALGRRSRAGTLRALGAVGPALALLVVWRIVWPALLAGGDGLRARHRWAAVEAACGGATRLLLWRPAPPWTARSPVEGAPNGLHLRVGEAGTARAQVRLGGGALAAGPRRLLADVTGEGASAVRLELGGRAVDVAPGARVPIDVTLPHGGGMLDFDLALTGAPGAGVWIDHPRLDPCAP